MYTIQGNLIVAETSHKWQQKSSKAGVTQPVWEHQSTKTLVDKPTTLLATYSRLLTGSQARKRVGYVQRSAGRQQAFSGLRRRGLAQRQPCATIPPPLAHTNVKNSNHVRTSIVVVVTSCR